MVIPRQGRRESMRILLMGLSVGLLTILMTCSRAELAPPMAEVVPHELEAHGDVRVDDYFWLNQRDNPAVIAYLESENAYMDAVTVAPAAATRPIVSAPRSTPS